MECERSRATLPKILVLEDEIELANLYAVWLGKTYHVEVANDCTRAYELLDDTIDVALLDRQLPDGTGSEVLTSIRDRDLDCAVAMVSAVDPDTDVLELGFDEYICKPVLEDELRGTVERLITQQDYSDALSELLGLTHKRTMLESHCSRDELANSEGFAELEARIEELDGELSQMASKLPETEISAELSGIGG